MFERKGKVDTVWQHLADALSLALLRSAGAALITTLGPPPTLQVFLFILNITGSTQGMFQGSYPSPTSITTEIQLLEI